jgi:hypothetical protein
MRYARRSRVQKKKTELQFFRTKKLRASVLSGYLESDNTTGTAYL